MATLTRAPVLLGLGVVVLAPAAGQAQAQLDFDVCNQQATAQAASPSASPAPEPAEIRAGSMTSPGGGIEANRRPNASGRMSVSAGSPGTAAGTTAGGLSGTATGRARAGDAEVPLRGMAAAGVSDEAYRRAYRECMKARGF